MSNAHGLGPLLDRLIEANRGDDVLRLGDAGPWLIDAIAARGVTVRAVTGAWASVQLAERHGIVVAQPSGEQAAAIVHCAVQHVVPGGLVVLCHDLGRAGSDDMAARFDLEPLDSLQGDGVGCTVHRRTERFTIHDLVVEARSTIRRVDAEELAAARSGPRPPIVVDTRTHTDRQRYGVIDGSIHAPR
ncbi:MAG: hypothetical protein ACM3MM_05820, partial [Acidobacteriota bacterium]